MEITCRNDAYLAKATLKSKLLPFERTILIFFKYQSSRNTSLKSEEREDFSP